MMSVAILTITAKDKGEKKLLGFAFTPLMREDGTTLTDDSHELYIYKVSKLSLWITFRLYDMLLLYTYFMNRAELFRVLGIICNHYLKWSCHVVVVVSL